AWTWDEHTQQYYFHQFDPKQPDLNWRNPDVRAAMMDVLRFWMKRGVDGFRMDVVYVIWKHPEMPDQPLIEGIIGRGEQDKFARQQQIYALNYEGVHDIMREIRQTLDEYGAVAIAELWLPVEERMLYYGTPEKPEFHIPFNFDFVGTDVRETWDADFFRKSVEAHETALPGSEWPNYVLGNHDIPRLASRYGSQARARIAAMMLLTLRGTPTLYMGDELGMVNGDIAPDEIQDPQGKILGVAHTRDVVRTPIQWDDSPYAGFSTTKPWLPVNDDYPQRNVESLLQDAHSILTLYCKLLKYRKELASLAVGAYRSVDAPEGVFAYERYYEGERHRVLLNFTAEGVSLPFEGEGKILISTHLDRDDSVSKAVTLRPDEGVVITLQ
ncbi:MAG: DUF3459 domain-containing protein, partial [Anaerolineae bacterium]|nr:DUF3459 domain-containing protein [Anaerolineae bacterium]